MIPHLVAACVAFAPTLTTAVVAEKTQRSAPSNSLSRVLGVFSASDADHDGRISAAEARAIPVASEEFAREDLDGDGSWSRDEFTLYYRARLIAGGQPVGADLDAEVARIHALKRVRVVEEARKQGVETSGGRGEVEPVCVRFEKALLDLEKSASTRKATPEDFRRLRNLVILSGRSVSESNRGNLPSAASTNMLLTLDRIERRAAAGQYAREDFDTLRALVATPSTPAPVGGIATPGSTPDPKSRPTSVPAPVGGPAGSTTNTGAPTNGNAPIQGPADARRRATDPHGANRAGPKSPPAPDSSKPPAPNPAPKPVPPQDPKKDPGRGSRS